MADNSVTVKISGLAELEHALERMPREASRKIMRNALVPAAELWREEMQLRVRRGPHVFRPKTEKGRKRIARAQGGAFTPKVFGFLAQHIGMRTRVSSELEGRVGVGPVKAGFWSLFLEFGTSKMRAFPFIRQAFEARGKQVLEKFIEGVKQALREAGMPLR